MKRKSKCIKKPIQVPSKQVGIVTRAHVDFCAGPKSIRFFSLSSARVWMRLVRFAIGVSYDEPFHDTVYKFVPTSPRIESLGLDLDSRQVQRLDKERRLLDCSVGTGGTTGLAAHGPAL